MKGAAVDMKTFRAEGARNIYIASMLLWGPGFFTSSALMMATIVERLLSSLFCASRTPGYSSIREGKDVNEADEGRHKQQQ